MANVYDAWRETKAHLKQDPDSKYLQAVEAELRAPAVRQFLQNFVDAHNGDPRSVLHGEIGNFALSWNELMSTDPEAQKQAFFNPAIGQVSRLRQMNWTADNTYGEAIDDAVQVLLAVWEGRPFPKLERFRCPSLYGTGKNQVRCQHQLPHESGHHWESGGKGVDWTDEQALNPPKDNDETPIAAAQDRCQSIDPVSGWMQCQYVPHVGGHRYKHVTWGGPQDATELTDAPTELTVFDERERKHKRCTHTYTVVRGGQELDKTRCILDQGHGDAHEDGQGRSWTNPYPEPGLAAGNPDPINRRPDTRGRAW